MQQTLLEKECRLTDMLECMDSTGDREVLNMLYSRCSCRKVSWERGAWSLWPMDCKPLTGKIEPGTPPKVKQYMGKLLHVLSIIVS